jgi:hypothetical protein
MDQCVHPLWANHHAIKDHAKKDLVKKDLAKKDHANGLALNHHVMKIMEKKDGMKNHVKDLHSLGVWEEDIWDLLDLDLISDLDHTLDSEDLGEDHHLDLEDLGEDHHVKVGVNHLAAEKNVMKKNVRKKKMKRKNVLNILDSTDLDQDVMEDLVSHQCGECHHVDHAGQLVHINTKKENVNVVK